MTAFYAGQQRPGGDSEAPRPEPELNRETAGPDQVIEHFRNDPLYQDLEDFELRITESPKAGNSHERRSLLLEQLCVRTYEAKLYLVHQMHRPLNGAFNPVSEQTEAFLRTAVLEHVAAQAGLSQEELGLSLLDDREAMLLRAYDDALAIQQEHHIKSLDKGEN